MDDKIEVLNILNKTSSQTTPRKSCCRQTKRPRDKNMFKNKLLVTSEIMDV
ncbi:hypothetical protein DPMN_190481 [Dreissena polymorpha]|uniref:Uncharacterized protein n=1 Tax=Dreissena polymorpha TaxID=45954 RepID=A0A9D4DXF8_DREPO|nr:hypothetical protein DPMN_190481 [Dreissena polymorpha]